MADENGKLTNQDLRILELRNKLEKENNDVLGEQRKLTSEIIDNLSQSLRGRKDVGELDKKSLKLTKDISNFQERIASSYDDIRKVKQDVNKADQLSANLAKQYAALTKQAKDENTDLAKEYLTYLREKETAQKREKQALDELANKRKAYQEAVASGTQKEINAARKAYDIQSEIVSTAKDQISNIEESKGKYVAQAEAIQASKDALAEQTKYLKEQEQVQKNLTTSIDKIENGLDRFGLKPLSKMLGLDKLNVQMKSFRYELTEGGTKGLNGIGKLAVGFKGLGTVISAALGPLAMVALAVTAIKKLVDNVKEGYEEGKEAAKKISEENVGLARNLGLAQGAAAKLAANVRGMGPTQAQSVASAEALYGAMGGTEKLSQNTLKTFIQLNTYAGMSAENLAEFHTFAKLSGEDSGVVVKNMANAALSSIKNNKLAVSQKVLLGDVAKVSDVIKLRYQGQEKELVKIVADARKYGLELAKAEDIANSLLNIEDSLSAEMEAELLTGKEINLEKAREAALNGDVATLQSEIAKNAGSIEEFNRMNVIQQEAYAKAVGLSRQDLSKMLKDQKSNLAVNGNLVDEQQDGLAAMKSGVSLAEKEENIERRKQEASISYFKALYPTIEKIKEAATKVKAVFAEWFGKKLESFLKDPGVKNFIDNLPQNAEKFAQKVTEVMDKIIGFVGANPWLSGIGFLFGGKIAGAGLKVLGSVFGEISKSLLSKGAEALGLKEKAATGTEKNPYYVKLQDDLIEKIQQKSGATGVGNEEKTPVDQVVETVQEASKSQTDAITSSLETSASNQEELNEKLIKSNGDLTKKSAKKISDATKKGAKDVSNATKKYQREVLRDSKGRFMSSKRQGDSINKNIKSQGREQKKLFRNLTKSMKGMFSSLKTKMNGLFKNLNAAVRRIGKGAGGVLGMLGPIGMVASVALPAISALASGEGLGGALEAIDPTGIVGSIREGMGGNEPEMATGGIVTKRTKAIVGEAGPEAVIPLKEFYAKMDELITAVKQGGDVYMDSRKVGEALVLGGFKQG